jgi:hypothetical protein
MTFSRSVEGKTQKDGFRNVVLRERFGIQNLLKEFHIKKWLEEGY